jgi:hypothetical protein
MDRRFARVLLFTAILSAAVLAAVYLDQSQVGLKGRAHGADWASHLGMIDLILRGEDVRAHGAQIGTGLVSPLFAHGLAAALSLSPASRPSVSSALSRALPSLFRW